MSGTSAPDDAAALDDDRASAPDLEAIAAAIDAPDEQARADARARQDRLTKPQGALGRLEDVSVWVSGVQGHCPPEPFERVRVLVLAGDHAVARTGVSAYPPEVTAQMVRSFVAGSAAINALSRGIGAQVRVIDVSVDVDPDGLGPVPPDVVAHRVRRGADDISVGPAMTREEAATAFDVGRALVDEEVDAGTQLLVVGDMGIGNTTPAAALTAVLTRSEVVDVVGRGTGIDDTAWMRKCAAVRDAARRGRAVKGDPLALLAAVAGPDLAAMTGVLVQAAVRRTPVVLDGVVSGACALVAQRISRTAVQWWIAGHRSVEPAHTVALQRLGLEPLLDLGLRLGEGTGGLLAVPLLNASALVLRDMATFDEAGVSERSDPEA